MDLEATLRLQALPDDADLDSVASTLRSVVCEWLDFDRHPADLTVSVGYLSQPRVTPFATEPQLKLTEPRESRCPVYCVSDLHAGDGGPRDNFAVNGRLEEFWSFLDFVESQDARLLILGDLFEFWQANLSKVLMHHLPLLDRLATMKARYIVGNHDADLLYFCDRAMLAHPFFERMVPRHEETIADQRIIFTHGHEVDPYCASDTPGKGRISAIYSGIWEDRHGSPWISKYKTVEEATVGRVERLLSFIYRLMGKPDRFKAMNRALLTTYSALFPGCVVVSGHTHRPGSVGARLYNTGTWAERTNSFVAIDAHGTLGTFNWLNGRPVRCTTELPI